MSENTPPGEFEGEAPKLKAQISAFREEHLRYRKLNSRWNRALILGAIAASTLVAIAGLIGTATGDPIWSLAAAILGIVGGALVAAQNALALGAKADFFRAVVTEAQNLEDSLSFGTISDREFKVAQEKLARLRKHAAEGVPTGQGMAGAHVQTMTRDIDSAG